MEIYAELEKLINERRIILPYDELLENEMLNLQRRYDSGRGFSVFANKEAECNTDDTCDALAGAVYNCLSVQANRLPASRTVSMPVSPQSGGRQWMSMQGVPYGFGSGEQVARQMRGPASRGFGFGF